MKFLMQLLAVDLKDKAQIVSTHWEFRWPALGWVIFLVVFALLAWLGVGLFYVLEKGTLGWFRRIFLIGVRCGLLLIVILLLLLQPVLVANTEGEQKVGVVLLVDNSQSMTQRDRRMTEIDKTRVVTAFNWPPAQDLAPGEAPKPPPPPPSNPSRQELVKGVLKNSKLNLVPGLEDIGPLRVSYFGHDLRGLKDDDKDTVKSILAGFKAEETRTALGDSIIRILEASETDMPSAIVVVTDGQDNASKYTLQEAAEKCRLKKIPLHIYGVGSTEAGQLQLKEVGGPSATLFAEDHVTIPLRWRAQGLTKGKVEIVLTLGGIEVGRKEVDVQAGEDLRDEFSFLVPKDPEKRETHDLVATVKYKGEGGAFEDKITRSMRIVDTRIKILYIENAPRWEFKFLQPALTNRFKKRCEVDFILVSADEKVANGGPPYLPRFFETKEKFLEAKYNLIILGDVPASYFKTETVDRQEWIKEFVEHRGGGLIVMAGPQNMPGSYEKKIMVAGKEENQPIAEVLPIEFKTEKFGITEEKATEEYMPTLTDEGKRTDWLSLADTAPESLDVWEKKLIGFHWNYPVTRLRGVASALVVHPRTKMPGDLATAKPMPVVATHLYGKGRVVWLGTDETWRWRWNHQDKHFDRFWGQLIYQLGSPSLLGDGGERTQIALNRSQAVVGTESTAHVTLLDKDFTPRKDLKVEAELENMDAKQGEGKKMVMLQARLNAQGQPTGNYTVTERLNQAGRYELRVKNPELNTFSFRVDLPPKHELEQAGLADTALRDAAKISGGKFYREETLSTLVGSIESRTTKFTGRQEVKPWQYLLAIVVLIMFLAMITLEWVIRKFSDLS